MAELLAAYVLATWFLPAFPAFSHLWILGDTGAGKSRLLHLLARLTHLGGVVPPSALVAPLRDLAALGASLAVDNADGLFASLVSRLTYRPGAATQRQALFLAGARRDVLFPLRQRLSARHQPPVYGLTHLDVFGPRLFAAQFPPPAAIAARALYLPLLRSTDRARCAADPDQPAAWPVSPRALLDDLWALSLAHLAELPAHVTAVTAASGLVGAYFQTWQPLLAVASWLTAHGVPGLLDRLRALAQDYPRQAEDIAPHAVDLTALTIHAIYGHVAFLIEKVVAFQAGRDSSDGSDDSFASGDSSDGSDDSFASGDSSDGSDDSFASGDGSDGSDDSFAPGDSSDGSDEPLDPVLIGHLRALHYTFNASLLLNIMRHRAADRTWDDIAGGLTPEKVGRILTALRLKKDRKNKTRFYTITLPELEHLLDAYRVPLPPILTVFRHFKEDTLRARLAPGSPGAPLRPLSPYFTEAVARLLRLGPHRPPPPKPEP